MKLYFKYINMEVMFETSEEFKYMHVNTSNMNKYYYNYIKIQVLDTKSKAIQHIKIEDIALSNTIGFECNTLKHYFFDKTAIIQILCCMLDKKQ